MSLPYVWRSFSLGRIGCVLLYKHSRGNAHNFLHDCVTTNVQGKHVSWNTKPKKNLMKKNADDDNEIQSQAKIFNTTFLSL